MNKLSSTFQIDTHDIVYYSHDPVIIILDRITIFIAENPPKLAPSCNHAKYISIFQHHNSYSYRIYHLYFSWYFSYFISLKNPTFDFPPYNILLPSHTAL